MTFFYGDKKIGDVYQGRGVQARWAGVNGVPPLIHYGDKLLFKFKSDEKGKCDKIFGYLFVVTAVFHELDMPPQEQRFPDLGQVIKNELKRFVFKRLSDSTSLSSTIFSQISARSRQRSTLSHLLSESWNCLEAQSFLSHLYSLFEDPDACDFLTQTLCRVPLNYDSKALTSLLNYHSTLLPQLRFSSLRSFGARISENLRSFVAIPSKDEHASFAMTEEVFFSGLHEFSVRFEPEDLGMGSSNQVFGIGVASSASVDLDSDGIFYFNSVGEMKLMGGQVKNYAAFSPPCIDQPVRVTLNMTVPKISIRQFGRVLLEQNLPPSLVSGGIRPLFIIQSSCDVPNRSGCRAIIEDNHCPDNSDFHFIDLIASMVSYKFVNELMTANPESQSIRTIIASNFEHFKHTCGTMMTNISESDLGKRTFWRDLCDSVPFLQLLFLHSCLHFPIESQISRFLPMIKASFDRALSNSVIDYSMDSFEIQVIFVLASVALLPKRTSCTISSIIACSPAECPLISCLHESLIGTATAGQPCAFLSRVLHMYLNIEKVSRAVSGDAFVLRSVCERIKREAADSIASRCFNEGNSEGFSVMDLFLSELGSDSDHQLWPLSSLLSSIPSHSVHRSMFALLTTMCKKLLLGQCSYCRDAIDFVTYFLCVSSRGSFSASRPALKHIYLSFSSARARSGTNFVHVSQAAITSLCPEFAAVLNLKFHDSSIVSLVNAGWAVVAARDGCARISVASACILCAVIQSNGGTCTNLSRVTGIPHGFASSCLRTLCQLGLVTFSPANDENVYVPTDLCSSPQCLGAFAPACESFCESELTSDCKFTDTDYAPIVQGILTCLPQTAFVAECVLTLQCANLTSAPPGKISHVLTYLEQKGLIVREGEYVALLSPHLEACAAQHSPFGTNIKFQLPSCILQIVIAVPSYREKFPKHSSISSAVCIPRSKFESFIGHSFSYIQPLTSIDQLQLSDIFIESDACVATILFSLHGGCASLPREQTRSEYLATKGFCPSCLEDDQDLVCPPCGHGACFVCWKGYINTALQDNDTQTVNQGSEDRLHITKLKCIADHVCDSPLSIDFLSRISPAVASSMVRLLQKSMCRSILSASPAIVQCQFCDFVIVAPNDLCEAQCTNCGRIKAVGDFKRDSPDHDWISHPNLRSADLATWQAMSQQGSVERYELMRFKKCPRCGAATTRCGCEDGKVICDGLERCPNERCDQ